jgi:hypothetical protein
MIDRMITRNTRGVSHVIILLIIIGRVRGGRAPGSRGAQRSPDLRWTPCRSPTATRQANIDEPP